MTQIASFAFVTFLAAACLFSAAWATYCSVPPSLLNGWHNGGMRRNYAAGYVVTYSCSAGYRLVGDRWLTCKYGRSYRSLYWEGQIPRCIRLLTNDDGDDDREMTHSSSRSSHSDSTRSGYSTSDSSHSDNSHSDSSRSGYSKSKSGSSRSNSKSNSDSDSKSGSSRSSSSNSDSDSKSGSSRSSSSNSDSDSKSGSSRSSSSNSDSDSKSGSSRSSSSNSDSNASRPASPPSNSPPVIRCPPLKPPENGKVHVIGYSPGLFARYICHYGYIHTGMLYRKCLHNGTWSGIEPKCIRESLACPMLHDPSNGHIKYTEGRKIGAKAWYLCQEGYTLNGSESRTCLHSLEWSGLPPSCEKREGCERLTNPKNGFVVVRSSSIGSHIKYNCYEGFYMSGPRFRECLPTGWSEHAPECLAVKCDLLKAPEYGRIIYSKKQYSNSTATYTCDYCYALDKNSGDEIRRCQDFGEWTGKAPKCIRIDCGSLQSPPNGSVLLGNTGLHSKAVYSCRDTHILKGQRTRLCLESGAWSGVPPKCVLKSVCEDLQRPDHGLISVRGSGPGAIATYGCSHSYVLRGRRMRMCMENGKWSGDMPTCHATSQCPNPPAPAHGHVQTWCLHEGCVATFSCYPYYMLQGRSKTWCLRSQRWSNKTPVCVQRKARKW